MDWEGESPRLKLGNGDAESFVGPPPTDSGRMDFQTEGSLSDAPGRPPHAGERDSLPRVA